MKTGIDITKRTKGEWEVTKAERYIEINTTEFNYSGSGICQMDSMNDDSEANASYICLAVNNFESLKSALEDLIAEFEFVMPNDFIVTKAAKEAIAKAELQSQSK